MPQSIIIILTLAENISCSWCGCAFPRDIEKKRCIDKASTPLTKPAAVTTPATALNIP